MFSFENLYDSSTFMNVVLAFDIREDSNVFELSGREPSPGAEGLPRTHRMGSQKCSPVLFNYFLQR